LLAVLQILLSILETVPLFAINDASLIAFNPAKIPPLIF